MSLQARNETFFSTAEAAEYLGFAEDTIRRYVYRGLLNAQKIGHSIVITKTECDRYKKHKRNPGRQRKSKKI